VVSATDPYTRNLVYRMSQCITDQILADLVHEVSTSIHLVIYKFMSYVWKKNKLHQQWNESIVEHFYKNGYKTDCISYGIISIQTFIQQYSLKISSTRR
jgi:hypothetical protein